MLVELVKLVQECVRMLHRVRNKFLVRSSLKLMTNRHDNTRNSDNRFQNYKPAQIKFLHDSINISKNYRFTIPSQLYEVFRFGEVVNNFLLSKAAINTLLFQAVEDDLLLKVVDE